MFVRERMLGGGDTAVWDDGLKAGLIRMWEFNGDLTEKIGGNDFNATVAPDYIAGKMKNALFYTAMYTKSPAGAGFTTPAIGLLTDWSMSIWVKYMTYFDGTYNRAVAEQNVLWAPSPLWSGFVIDLSQNYRRVYVTYSTTITQKTPQYVLPNDDWVHVFVAKNSILYINGVKTSFETSVNNNLNFSSALASSLAVAEQLGVWNRTLSEQEILQIYNEGNGLRFN